MKKLLLFSLLPLMIYAKGFDLPRNNMVSNMELEKCYENGDDKCGKDLAFIYKNKPEKEERAAEIFLDLSLKGDQEATKELALLYIYGKKIPQDCKKGIYILLNAADGKTDRKASTLAFKEISSLFEKGICVEKDLKKAKKYNDVYLRRAKAEMNLKNK